MLKPYRVLDLTDVRGQIAGLILGDLGADVIRVEPPSGSDARRAGPFLDDGPETERSLSFAAYNRNKRSVVLDIDRAADHERFLALVAGSDFVIDSGPDGAIDFESLEGANPRIVHVRISAFGVDGPYALRPAADLTVAAMGGPMAVQGEPDRPPIRLSVPQVWRHAGAEAAVAALVAHARMRTTGKAAFADVSAQATMTWTMLNAMTAHAIQREDFERAGSILQLGNFSYPLVHACADGHVVTPPLGVMVTRLAKWMLETGVTDEAWLAREDWATYDDRLVRNEQISIPYDEFCEVLARFFARHDKRTLFVHGLELGQTLAPVQTLDDLLAFDQLKVRGFFEETELATGQRAQVPGAFAKPSRVPLTMRRDAPRLGEHSDEILTELDTAPRVRVDDADAPRSLPLEGLKVADFSWVGVGPISGKYLADHGADVIRVEWEGRPDGLRAAGPFLDGTPGWNRSHFYGEFNTSKRCIALDLKHARAREVTDRMLEWADVVLESFTPGAVDRIGIGYETARKLNPGIVMVSTCLMGQTGPAAAMAGYGFHAAAIAGFFEVAGWPDRMPAGPWNAYTDTIAPRFLTATLLAALDHRRRTGEGQHIDLAQLEAGLQLLAPEILARQTTGENFTRMGNRSHDAAPQGVYPCAGEDQWCAIAIENDTQWLQLCAVLDDPDWSREASFASVAGRIAAHDAIDARIAEWTGQRESAAIVETLAAGGVPVAPVQRSSDLLVDPQYAHRKFHRTFEHEEMGSVPYSGHQFRIAGYDNGPRAPAPLLGAHTIEVLSEVLGVDDETIGQLFVEGAVA